MLEASLDEVDPFEPKPKQHPGHAMPSGIGARVKPQMQPPRSTPRSAPLPQRRVDPATEFLRGKGALQGISGPGSGVPPKGAGGPAGRGPGSPRPAGGKGPESVGGLPDEVKPKYPGTYVGQTVDTGGRYVRKPVSWSVRDPETGGSERRFGGVQSKTHDLAVWDGKAWVSQADFDRKFAK